MIMIKKIKKNQKGFTLVEVIVVAVIVAVLAAVAIPLYMGYIRDSRTNVANNTAGTVASACGATLQQDADLLPDAADYTDAAPLILKGLGTEDNVINIPEDFTVTITATTAQCFYKKGGTGEIAGKVYTFKSGT